MRCTAMVSFAALLALGCAPKGGGMAAGGAMAVDTAAAKSGIDSLRTRYARLQMAGDAAAVAALYDQNATLDLYGLPRTKGRANIEAALKADFAMRKFSLAEITAGMTTVRTNDDASEIGTYHDMYTLKGTVTHEWGRYVVGNGKGADGNWRLTYLMVFPDSTKAEKK